MNRQANHSGTFIMLSKNSPSYSYVEDDNRTENVGNVVMNVSYDPFGNIISGKLTGEYGFSTKPLVDGVDWYYYGFRYYDPVTGRWPNRDPIGEAGHEQLFYDYEEAAALREIENEISFLYVEIIDRISKLKSKKIDTFKDIEEALEEVDDIEGSIYELLYLAEWVQSSNDFAESLLEGPSLYAFIANDAVNFYDILGEAKGGKQNVRTTGGGNSIADQKAAGTRHSSQSKNKKPPPKKSKKNLKKAAAKALKTCAKFGVKKIPVIGWGLAAHGAYHGYTSGGFSGAVSGAIF